MPIHKSEIYFNSNITFSHAYGIGTFLGIDIAKVEKLTLRTLSLSVFAVINARLLSTLSNASRSL